MIPRASSLAVAMALLLAAQPGLPGGLEGNRADGAAQAQPVPGTESFDPRNPPVDVRVRPGETLFDVAERTRSPLQGLIQENGLQPPFRLQAGQVLRLPPLKVHVVQRGEGLAQIADRYGIDRRSLRVFNGLPRDATLRPGQRIILPPLVEDRLTGLEPQDLIDLLAAERAAGRPLDTRGAGRPASPVRQPASRQTPAAPASAPASTPAAPAPAVPRGQVAQLPQIPQLPPETGPGAAPGAAPAGPPSTARPSAPGGAPATSGTPRLPGPPTASGPPAPPRSAPPPRSAAPGAPRLPSRVETPAPGEGGRFSWPILGRVVETFGEKPGFRKSDGIEIEAAEGAPFGAAAAGTVAYVGNELPGYGWLVLVDHGGEWMTAYAYASRITVRPGQRVTRGQTLGAVGVGGRARTPRLHFQVRRGTDAVDPARQLPRAGAA
jgi:murein DD-endopeptidase MepM/ murein hydrolase activator NlpD